ncbi:hypothetical protein [Clostridium kluyveri]|uniref:Uncharacterized protein n=2 Tax=Clostridium kluyveri TaxID=1534 RepID=A5N2B7_CLOK5|nr:hypothetical protein [Clostridium kluyveri]EDK35263.1 Hypothetical protein CKL_3260 [Clostridium kluyveri DSM 555]BAH07935.1 hypothetical protein CKR_2884 [Clostridium kluyveri NBRC 12016]
MQKKKILKIGIGVVLIIVVVFATMFYKAYKYVKRENEAHQIANIVKRMDDLRQLYDINNENVIDEEIKECDKILEELHEENSSGNISDESLKSIMDNSISAVENHKKSLNAFKDGDIYTFSEFSKKSNENVAQLNNELERLGFSKEKSSTKDNRSISKSNKIDCNYSDKELELMYATPDKYIGKLLEFTGTIATDMGIDQSNDEELLKLYRESNIEAIAIKINNTDVIVTMIYPKDKINYKTWIKGAKVTVKGYIKEIKEDRGTSITLSDNPTIVLVD